MPLVGIEMQSPDLCWCCVQKAVAAHQQRDAPFPVVCIIRAGVVLSGIMSLTFCKYRLNRYPQILAGMWILER